MRDDDEGQRQYFGVGNQRRHDDWQSIYSKMEHLSYDGADVLALNAAASFKMLGLIWQSLISCVSLQALNFVKKRERGISMSFFFLDFIHRDLKQSALQGRIQTVVSITVNII